MKAKILLVEDEKNFAAVLKDYLQMNDFEVTLAEDGESGLEFFRRDSFDLCIADVMMPKKDGFTFVKEIKQLNSEIPVIFLTAKSLRDDVLKGYRLGADDYILKPFDTEVLLFKIRAILNRKQFAVQESPGSFELGSLKFNYRLRTIYSSSGKETRLSPKEAELLNLLCMHINDVLPKEKALRQIWKEDTYFTGRSMDVYIVKLRKFLHEDERLEIVNLHGNGYRLVCKGS
ncbi:MAG: response regulator transcription factor [Bacteroidia bacterium]